MTATEHPDKNTMKKMTGCSLWLAAGDIFPPDDGASGKGRD